MFEGDVVLSMMEVGFCYQGSDAPALSNVTLEVRKGERVAVIGSNGSGKSTLAKLINALLIPTQGACLVCSLDTKNEDDHVKIRQYAAIVFQDPEDQIVASTVEEDTAFGPENLCLPTEEIERRVGEALEAVGLSERAKDGTYTLSGGQKQRLAIAGALALEPTILVLDEGTSMLDPQGRGEVERILQRLSARGMTVIQVTHDMSEAANADRVVLVEDGALVWQGTSDEFFSEEAASRGHELPAELVLWRELTSNGAIPTSTERSIDAIISALCL